MKRYLVLSGHSYYPAAWQDWVGQFDNIEDADTAGKKQADRYPSNYGWYSIFDLENEIEVEH